MYDAAQSRCVSRAELGNSDLVLFRESSVDVDVNWRFNAITKFEYINVPVQRESPDLLEDESQSTEAQEDGIAFRLFAPAAGPLGGGQAQLIRVHSPTPESSAAETWTHRPRPESFYFTGPLSDALAAEYDASVLSGAQVLAMSKGYYPGMAYPWKVIAADKVNDPTSPDLRKTRRTRLGKHARIKRRTKLANEAAKLQKQAEDAADKERHLREKKARLNRERKLKKRAKEKLKKTGGVAAAADSPDT